MIEERAVVMEAGDNYAWLEIQRRLACGSCGASDGCGTAALATVLGGRRTRVRVVSKWPLRAGDEVIVGLADGVLLRGALLVYLLPLALLLAGALLGEVAFAGAGEEPVVLLGIIGLGVGFLGVRILSRRFWDDVRYQPVVLRRLNAVAAPDSVLSTS